MDANLYRVSPVSAGDEALTADAVRNLIHDNAEPSLRLEGTWPALHFLLTGEVPIPREEALRRGISWRDDSLENALLGGVPTQFSSSFGPARHLPVGTVAAVSRQLDALSPEAVRDRFDPEALEEEQIPVDDPADDQLPERLTEAYTALADFYRAAATNEDSVLIVFI